MSNETMQAVRFHEYGGLEVLCWLARVHNPPIKY
jgi:hypothetical protein